MDIKDILQPEKKDEGEENPPLFRTIYSEILGESIVIVFKREGVKPARKENPGLVLYTRKEVRELKGLDPDQIRLLHFAKNEFNGAIYPADKEASSKGLTRRNTKLISGLKF